MSIGQSADDLGDPRNGVNYVLDNTDDRWNVHRHGSDELPVRRDL